MQGLYTEIGGMPGDSGVDSGRGGGKSVGGGSAGGKKAQKSWSKTPAGLALSTPLLPPSDSEQIPSRSTFPEDGVTLDRSGHGSNIKPSDSVESQEFRDMAGKEIGGPSGRQSLRMRRGITHRASMRVLQSGTVMSSMRAIEIFAEPLASEGAGSVFPIALPMAKRRAYEADFIKQFDRLAINCSSGDFWTVIDASWITDWVGFIMGNKPPPGPVSNYQLYDQHSTESEAQRQSLVWFIFREIYDTDGSPDIFRWRPDIYSAEVVGSRKAKYVEKFHTQALYKLRRFSTHVKEAVEARGA